MSYQQVEGAGGDGISPPTGGEEATLDPASVVLVEEEEGANPLDEQPVVSTNNTHDSGNLSRKRKAMGGEPEPGVVSEGVVESKGNGVSLVDRWGQATGRQFLGLTEKEGEDEWRGPFFFAQLADTQLGAIDDNVKWDEDLDLARLAVEHVNRLKPRFAIVCGDLVNHVPHMYPDTDPEIRTRQVLDFKEVMGKIDPDIPLLCVCGNHDVGNVPNKVTIDRYTSEFGDDYFAFWVGGVRGLVLNSNLLFDPSEAMELYERQEAWLRSELEAAKSARATHIIVFAHHPFFLVRDDEDEDINVIGNLVFDTKRGEHVCIPNTYFHVPLERRQPLLQLFKDYDVRYIFSGHWHKNGIAKSERFGIENIITSAVGLQLGPDRPGFRLVKVFEEDVIHEYFAMPDMPSGVSVDPNNKTNWSS